MSTTSTTILAGYDGTAASRAALDLALRLAKPDEARVIAVTAYAPAADARLLATAGVETSPALRAAAGLISADAVFPDPAERHAEATLADLHVAGLECRALAGTPTQALCAIAEQEAADLIVVGATHRGVLGRLAPGSVAQRLLQGAPCAVAVSPAEVSGTAIRTVAVAYDGRHESKAALARACRVAEAQDAALQILAVCAAPAATDDMVAVGLRSPARERMQAEVDHVVTELPAALHPRARVLTGGAGPTLVEASRDIDLLVAGSRSYGPLRGAVVGSVSRHLVDHAHCPIVIVPRSLGSHDE